VQFLMPIRMTRRMFNRSGHLVRLSLTGSSFEKHMDTLFRVTHSSNFNTSIQALMLIQQLVTVHPGMADRFYRTLYESLLDPRLLTTSKQALYLNLLYKAMSADLSTKRVKAFTKRLLQVASLHQASFASAAIYLVRELENVFPSLRSFIDQIEVAESDDEEVFKDVLEAGENPILPLEVQKGSNGANNSTERPRMSYDGRKRDPQHSNAESSCVWEIVSQPYSQAKPINLEVFGLDGQIADRNRPCS